MLETVTDGRARRGQRHRLPAILATVLLATISGAQSFTAIADWITDATADQLRRLGYRNPAVIPHESTIRRAINALGADAFDAVIGAWLAARAHRVGDRAVIAIDGKPLRGARNLHGNLTHLLAACTHDGIVIGQVNVPGKSDEITYLARLLATIDVRGPVLTADALHCQRSTAELIAAAGGDYIFTIKGNQPALLATAKSVTWRDIPTESSRPVREHGRRTYYRIQATELTAGIGFPAAERLVKSVGP